MPIYILADNGSKKPDATLKLRRLADLLSEKTGTTVYPVSLQHSDSIDPALLNGRAADVLPGFIEEKTKNGENEFIVIPLFFGESRALTSFIPDVAEKLKSLAPGLKVHVTKPVYPLPDGEPRLAQILIEHIVDTSGNPDTQTKVVLVDHGTPSKKINDVRRHIASQLSPLLNKNYQLFQAVMERRDGKEYDFNGELLKDWLVDQAKQGETYIIIAMLFFLPGKHAGSCGDIETICDDVRAMYPELKYKITPLICEHPMLIDILSDRLISCSIVN